MSDSLTGIKPRHKLTFGQAIACAMITVVVGVVIFPVIGKAKDGRSPDFYRMRSISKAQEIYLQDHDMRLQAAGLWMDALYPYVKTTTTFIDWQAHLGKDEGPAFDDRKSGQYGYSFFHPVSLKALSEFEFPERQIMIFQSSDLRWNANGLLDSIAFRRGGIAARVLTAVGSSRIVREGAYSTTLGVIDVISMVPPLKKKG